MPPGRFTSRNARFAAESMLNMFELRIMHSKKSRGFIMFLRVVAVCNTIRWLDSWVMFWFRWKPFPIWVHTLKTPPLLGVISQEVTYIETKFMNFDLTGLSMLYHYRNHPCLGQGISGMGWRIAGHASAHDNHIGLAFLPWFVDNLRG